MTVPSAQEEMPVESVPPDLVLAFAPIHKRAFGTATGVAFGLLIGGLTVVHLLRSPDDPFPLSLLAEYFYGYTVSLPGALIGGSWAGLAAFVFGWFLAFVRNFVLATMLFIGRTRVEMAATRDFLDHV